MDEAFVRAELQRLGRRIGARPEELTDVGTCRDAGYACVVRRPDGLHWQVWERGRLLDDRVPRDPDELLFWCLETTASELASEWELHHRVDGDDSRRLRWAVQGQLLHALSPAWAQRWHERLRTTVRDAPGLLPDLPPPDVVALPLPRRPRRASVPLRVLRERASAPWWRRLLR